MNFKKIKTKILGGDSRTAKMSKNIFAMLGIKGLSILISLLYVPMMLSAVDRTDYGILLTLTSIVQWVSMLDVGLGNGLRNRLSEYLAKGDYAKAKESVSSCYAALCSYMTIVIALFLFISPSCSWTSILNAPDNDEAELLNLANVVFIAFCVQFIIGLINSILYAFQMPAMTSVMNLASQGVTFVIVYILINFFGMTSILEIGSLTCLIPPVIMFIGSVILFKTKLKVVSPSFKCARIKSVGNILNLGIKFFVLQIITIVLFQANNIIIAQAAGPDSVVEYNIAYKYIGMITMIFTIMISPLWSATTDAYIRGEYDWIKRTVRRMARMTTFITVAGVFMVLISKFVFKIWLGKDLIDIPYSTTALCLAFVVFEMFYRVFGTMINATGKVMMQMIITSILAILYIPLAYGLGVKLGLAGVLIANCIIHFLNFTWARYQYNLIINKKAVGIWNR